MNRTHIWMALGAMILTVGTAHSQTFSSGSDGSDGALNLTTAGTVIFNPSALGLHGTGVANNVFNFTTINIANGVTLQFQSDLVNNQAVIWLATGNVTIAGQMSLSGQNGAAMNPTDPGLTRSPAQPGPGGFPGGVGFYLNSGPTAGGGYGGGAPGPATGNGTGGFGVYSYYNTNLTPLYGGAGGGGGNIASGGVAGGNGGAGGGAIRIVSTTAINLTGSIDVSGGGQGGGVGNAYSGGAGSAGAVHIIAPTFSGGGNGNIIVDNCNSSCIVQMNTTNYTFTGGYPGLSSAQNLIVRPLFNPPIPSGLPSVTVTSLNNISAPVPVTASYQTPDFTIDTTSPATVNIAAQNIPTGTVVKLYLTSDQGSDQTITCAPLAGTLASSTASCTGIPFPPGITITDIEAIW